MKKNTSERTERAALYGLLTALAMVLGFVESLIPIPFPVPGILSLIHISEPTRH